MIFTIKTSDEVAGLDIAEALSRAGISHTILSKQHDEAAQHRLHPTSATPCAVCGDDLFRCSTCQEAHEKRLVGKASR